MELKKIEEKFIQKEVALTLNEIYQAEERLKLMEIQIEEFYKKMEELKLKPVCSPEIMLNLNYFNSLQSKHLKQKNEISQLHKQLENLQKKLLEKTREKKTFERLKEVKFDEYKKELKKEQQIFLDEITYQNSHHKKESH